MRRCIGLVMMLACVTAVWSAAPPVKGAGRFTQEQTAWLSKSLREIDERRYAGRFEEAENLARERLALVQRVLGRDHWRTRDEQLRVEDQQQLTKVLSRQRQEVGRAIALNEMGMQRQASGAYGEALKLFRGSLALREKALGETHPDTAESYNNVASCLLALGKSSEALPLHKKALAICQKALGEGHASTAANYNNVASCLQNLGRAQEALPLYQKALVIREKALGKVHPLTAMSYNNVASCLSVLGKPAETLPLAKQALEIWEKTLGEAHPTTAQGYNNVASCLNSLGGSSEALPLFKKALEIWEKTFGENHPETAHGYAGVANCLRTLGKSAAALPLSRKALVIHEKVLGDAHPDTAGSYDRVALCLQSMGKSSEALALFKKALSIREKVLPEDHPKLATSYNNVAACLDSLGKASESLPLYRKSVAINEKSQGEAHPDTARSYHNAALCLVSLGKASEALPLLEKSLAIFEKALGEAHPATADGCNSVALCLNAMGKSVEALLLFRKALAIREKTLGECHPLTALCCNNVAGCLNAMGKSSEALPLHRKALAIWEKTLGEAHPDTAVCYNDLTLCLWDLGQTSRAVRLVQQSLAGQEAVRLLRVHDSGFDRAVAQAREFSPRAGLAVALAKLKQPRNAFAHAEASLSRGLLDDLASATSADAVHLRELQDRLKRLDAALIALVSPNEPTVEQLSRREQIKREQRAVLAELTQLVALRVSPLERIQKAIAADAALVMWIDIGERWACVVRREGIPLWTELPGSARDGSQTEDDKRLPARLHRALSDPSTTDAERRELSNAFAKQLFDPLRSHLKGVKRLFVVPSGPLARVPLEALTSEYAISYIPSGSVLALIAENHRAVDGTSLLAVGDPVFDKTLPPEPPSSGVLVLSVVAGSHAAKAGLQPGDVLLSVGTHAIDSFDDLQSALSGLPANGKIWREGKLFMARIAGSPLGAVFDKRGVRAAMRAFRQGREGVATRGTGHKRLPGTRLEVEAISALVKSSKTLLGSDASEQKLDELQARGKLKTFKILHIATHGETDERSPGRSALILAQDALPDALEQVRQQKHVYDGRLTVSRIRGDADKGGWELDADLVVLSACETGLGQDAKGDGLLGFAQAFIHKGARSVVLSRWKVDDTATSLLMIRFYENLLAKRKDGQKAMGRAASLDEAKKWLRELSRKDAEHLATLHTGGVLRGSEGDEKLPADVKAVEYKADKPFAHPFYWAAFTLIGDPD